MVVRPLVRQELAAARVGSYSRCFGELLRSMISARGLVWAIVASRLLVLAAGAYASLFTRRLSNWNLFDPTGLTTSLGTVGNLLTAASVRWDSLHYLSIAAHGYKPAGDTGFFPFYPLLIRVTGWLVGSDVIAGLLISLVSFAIALSLLHQLTREQLGRRAADATVLLLAFAPLTLFFSAIYTESLLFALSVGTFFLARHGHLRWACLTAACATVTQVEGVALWAPLAFMFWESDGRRLRFHRLFSLDGAALLMPLVALLGLLLYMHLLGFGWLAPITGSKPIGHGYSIAPYRIPSHGPALLVRSIDGPFVTIWRAILAGAWGLYQTLHGAVPIAPNLSDLFTIGFQNLIYLIVLAISLSALAGAWRLLPTAYAIYATLVILVFTMSVVTLVPLRAFDRYMLPQFPLWMVAANWLDKHRLLRPVLIVSPILTVFYTIEFARWAMIA